MLRWSPTQTIHQNHQNNNIYDNQEIILFVNRCVHEILCAKILSLSLVGNFLNEKPYSLIRLLTSRFVSFRTLFCLSDTQNPTNNVTYWNPGIECTFSRKYDFLYFWSRQTPDIFFRNQYNCTHQNAHRHFV